MEFCAPLPPLPPAPLLSLCTPAATSISASSRFLGTPPVEASAARLSRGPQEKFLLDKEGNPIKRFSPKFETIKLEAEIKALL